MATAPGPIGVLVALREEMRAIEPGLRRFGAAAARTGMGRANAREKTARFIDERGPSVIVAAGFAGGLSPGLATGDVLVAERVLDGGKENARLAPAHLIAAARAVVASIPARFGTLLTADRVLSSSASKRQAHETTGADAVDMESIGVLEAAEARGVPVICVRAVLDEAEFDLPFDFGRILTPEGRPRLLSAVAEIASRPRSIPKLIDLRARAQAASKSLAAFVPRLVEALS